MSEQQKQQFTDQEEESNRAADAAALEEAIGQERQAFIRQEKESACRQERQPAAKSNQSMLETLRAQASRQPTAAQIREKVMSAAKADKMEKQTQKKKGKKAVEHEAAPVPVFPHQRAHASAVADSAGRRREMAVAMRSRTEESKSHISIASSNGVSLEEMSARLNAPTLSSDWKPRDADDSDDEEPMLQVDMPENTTARQLFDDEVRRKNSAAIVKKLTQKVDSKAKSLLKDTAQA